MFKSGNYNESELVERLERENLSDFYKKLRALIDFWFCGTNSSREILDFEIYTVTGGTYGNLENAYLRKSKQKGKAAIIFERLFPPFKLMSSRYPVLKKCPLLLPVFFPVRIVSSLFNGRAKKNAQALRGASKKEKELEKLSRED